MDDRINWLIAELKTFFGSKNNKCQISYPPITNKREHNLTATVGDTNYNMRITDHVLDNKPGLEFRLDDIFHTMKENPEGVVMVTVENYCVLDG